MSLQSTGWNEDRNCLLPAYSEQKGGWLSRRMTSREFFFSNAALLKTVAVMSHPLLSHPLLSHVLMDGMWTVVVLVGIVWLLFVWSFVVGCWLLFLWWLGGLCC